MWQFPSLFLWRAFLFSRNTLLPNIISLALILFTIQISGAGNVSYPCHIAGLAVCMPQEISAAVGGMFLVLPAGDPVVQYYGQFKDINGPRISSYILLYCRTLKGQLTRQYIRCLECSLVNSVVWGGWCNGLIRPDRCSFHPPCINTLKMADLSYEP
jgi:hypothetical protein